MGRRGEALLSEMKRNSFPENKRLLRRASDGRLCAGNAGSTHNTRNMMFPNKWDIFFSCPVFDSFLPHVSLFFSLFFSMEHVVASEFSHHTCACDAISFDSFSSQPASDVMAADFSSFCVSLTNVRFFSLLLFLLLCNIKKYVFLPPDIGVHAPLPNSLAPRCPLSLPSFLHLV